MEPNEARPALTTAPKKNSNIIYFLIGIIAFLIGTNIFVYLKKNETTQKLVTQTAQARDEKSAMQEELNKMESDLASSTNGTKKLTADLQEKDTELKDKIAELKNALHSNTLTKQQLSKAKEQISELRSNLQKYNQDISALKEENKSLNTQNTTLKTTVDSVTRKTTELTSQNDVLTKKVNTASALRASAINAKPVKIKASGRETEVRSAKRATSIRVDFTIADNELNQEGPHDIYVIITDPAGKLEGGETAGHFKTPDGQDLQYTTRTTINFLRANKTYTLEWPKSSELTAGDYKTVMYADGYKMGETSFKLRKGGLF